MKKINILNWSVVALIVALAVVSCIVTYEVTKVSYQHQIEELEGDLKIFSAELDEKASSCESLKSQIATLEERYTQQKRILDVKDEIINNLKTELEVTTSAVNNQVDDYEPGAILSEKEIPEDYLKFFKAYEIEEGDAVYERINGKSYRKNKNIGLEDICYLKLLHYNFDHKVQVGEMVVNKAISEDILNIFRELFEQEYEIQSIYLVDNYWTGDPADSDTNSIEYNNTSCFNYRVTTGGSSLSNHAYGRAIDINPQQNPYVRKKNGEWSTFHDNAKQYAFNREDLDDAHVIKKGDVCYNIFTKYGFKWGGNWSNPIDYQHFEKE